MKKYIIKYSFEYYDPTTDHEHMQIATSYVETDNIEQSIDGIKNNTEHFVIKQLNVYAIGQEYQQYAVRHDEEEIIWNWLKKHYKGQSPLGVFYIDKALKICANVDGKDKVIQIASNETIPTYISFNENLMDLVSFESDSPNKDVIYSRITNGAMDAKIVSYDHLTINGTVKNTTIYFPNKTNWNICLDNLAALNEVHIKAISDGYVTIETDFNPSDIVSIIAEPMKKFFRKNKHCYYVEITNGSNSLKCQPYKEELDIKMRLFI